MDQAHDKSAGVFDPVEIVEIFHLVDGGGHLEDLSLFLEDREVQVGARDVLNIDWLHASCHFDNELGPSVRDLLVKQVLGNFHSLGFGFLEALNVLLLCLSLLLLIFLPLGGELSLLCRHF